MIASWSMTSREASTPQVRYLAYFVRSRKPTPHGRSTRRDVIMPRTKPEHTTTEPISSLKISLYNVLKKSLKKKIVNSTFLSSCIYLGHADFIIQFFVTSYLPVSTWLMSAGLPTSRKSKKKTILTGHNAPYFSFC